MYHLRKLSVIVTILTCFLQAQGADKYTDENRPYEFGFTIDGEQHRHEKKDENGLIMGEFGFITADGVYHVTVYATDENGNFKILSMKNIRVKPYPTAPARKGNSLPFPPSQGTSAQVPNLQAPSPQPPVQLQPVSLEPPVKSCSHCSIPTTTKAPELNDFAVVSRDDQAYNNPQYPQNTQYPQDSQYPQNAQAPQYPENPQNYPNQPSAQEFPQQGAGVPQYPDQNLPSGERNPKQYDVSSQYPQDGSPPTKPVLISAQMQIVNKKDTDIYQRGPGEKEGLPNGLTTGDMQQLLYTFNYTVGFHGHHEEGYRNGAKIGYYYVTGRNGVRTRVDYVADEKGFRPKITQEVLDLLSDDVPKPETEKDEKYGLKGYEFKWLYYPVDSKRR